VTYLQELGVTTVELLPVSRLIDDRRLVEHKLRNYWGYNTIGFFAPEQRYLQNGEPKRVQDDGQAAARGGD